MTVSRRHNRGDVFPPFPAADYRTKGDHHDVEQQMFFAAIVSWISQTRKMRQYASIGDHDSWAAFPMTLL
jgi:hypothetical protein